MEQVRTNTPHWKIARLSGGFARTRDYSDYLIAKGKDIGDDFYTVSKRRKLVDAKSSSHTPRCIGCRSAYALAIEATATRQTSWTERCSQIASCASDVWVLLDSPYFAYLDISNIGAQSSTDCGRNTCLLHSSSRFFAVDALLLFQYPPLEVGRHERSFMMK